MHTDLKKLNSMERPRYSFQSIGHSIGTTSDFFCCGFSMPKHDHRSLVGSEKGCFQKKFLPFNGKK